MKKIILGALICGSALAQGACSDGFGTPKRGSRLTVDLIGADDPKIVGTKLDPLPLQVEKPQPFRIIVRARDPFGNIDTSFNGFVRVSSKPGAIERINSDDADGRSLRLTNGESPEVEVRLTNGYGATYILADDIGYAPSDPVAEPPPACSNALDDDGDGIIDAPADEGCAFANDNSETGGNYSQGSSAPIFYRLPRVADVRGLKCVENFGCAGNGSTVYPKEQIFLDTGYHQKPDGALVYDFDLVVTRISSDGFYVSDVKDQRGGFNSIFSFNFNAPPRMRVCDRLKSFGGTANEFFGFTQISYPTWTLEEWDPTKRPCLVPEPHVITTTEGDPTQLLPLSGSLVRALGLTGKVEVKVTPKFGPGNLPQKEGAFLPTVEGGTNCDLNNDGRIDFTKGQPEEACSTACTADPECTEYSNFAARSTFRITIKDLETGVAIAVQADATASAEFKPLEMKGKPMKAFTGTLHFFSGGSQFTIEARCKDDIVLDLNQQALPSDKACVFPRTVLDENPQ
jgi:hypothetical protein